MYCSYIFICLTTYRFSGVKVQCPSRCEMPIQPVLIICPCYFYIVQKNDSVTKQEHACSQMYTHVLFL